MKSLELKVFYKNCDFTKFFRLNYQNSNISNIRNFLDVLIKVYIGAIFHKVKNKKFSSISPTKLQYVAEILEFPFIFFFLLEFVGLKLVKCNILNKL